jgi:hypothetical protein
VRQPVLPNELQDRVPSEVRLVLLEVHHRAIQVQQLLEGCWMCYYFYPCPTTAYTRTTWTGSCW